MNRTHTSTHTVTDFADPYKKCKVCGAWVDGVANVDGPVLVWPCEHRGGYVDLCPSWSPVDGCRCDWRNGGSEMHPHRDVLPEGKVA